MTALDNRRVSHAISRSQTFGSRRFVNSYYWTIDVADTLAGPDVSTSSPIYEGAHYYRTDRLTGVVLQMYFFVSYISGLAATSIPISFIQTPHPNVLIPHSFLSSNL